MKNKIIGSNSSPLPDGWRWVKLKDLGIFESGGTPAKENDNYWNGKIPFVTGADITSLNINKCNARSFLTQTGLYSSKTAICKPDTVLIVTRTRVGRAGIARELMGASQDITAFHCNDKIIIPEFLCRYLYNISEYLIENCRGATIQGLTRKIVDHIQVPLPPLSEQKRIASILQERLAAVEKARKSAEEELETINALPSALLRQAFNGEL